MKAPSQQSYNQIGHSQSICRLDVTREATMLKDPEASGSTSFLAGISHSDARERPRRSAINPGQVGFVGLGRMGAAMAANLAAAGRRVIGYVRRPEQGQLEALK